MSFDNTDTNPRIKEIQKREKKQKLYQAVRDAYQDYFSIPVGRQQKKWDRITAARDAVTNADLPPFREDQWTGEKS